ncbi:MAG TPA: aminotransferase class V-fold PLP-dependent enzyme [Anaerolineaceae bacterium]|nr:aminotransferase class V-fold PLP-dependent enzyme [Anaerolineaceae bacterium]HPN50995.1 aminotransferase class V-fold PLP-dependent enzyme [Anaerolineaceae bacterium]
MMEIRNFFPVTEKYVFLNNAAESPLCTRVKLKLDEYLAFASEAPQNKPSPRHAVRTALSGLLGGEPRDYALVTSTGVGVGLAAAGYPWQPGDNMVVPADEHWNNTFPWLALREKGVEVRLAPVGADRRVSPETIAGLVDSRTRILATAAVRFDTGFRADLKALSAIAHASGALFLVDGIQAAGVVPLNVVDDGIDLLASAGFKWLLGLPGTGFLYTSSAAREKIRPVLPGMFAAEDSFRELRYFNDARRYETGSIAYSLFYAWTAGLDLLMDLRITNIHARVLALTDRLIAGLPAKRVELVSPVEKPEERSAILSITTGSDEGNKALFERLMAQNIIVALRGGRIRVSPNFFNTEAEIDRFLEAL